MPVDMGIRVTSFQFDFVRELIDKLARPIPNDLTRIERAVRVGFMQNFARQGVGGGPRWLPLAPRTERERRQQGYGATGPILRRRNVYAQSWTRVGGWRQLDRTASGWVLHVSSDHPWAFLHELGNAGRRVPPRPVRYLDDGAMRVIGQVIERWVDDVIRVVMT